MKSIMKYIKPYFDVKKNHPSAGTSDQNQEEYILMTYRSGINKLINTTYYTSDSGWGCMLRVGQMFIANIYYKIQGRNELNIIQLFYDNTIEAPFSIQRFTQQASFLYQQKQKQQWFTPLQCGYLIKRLLENLDGNYRVSIFNDNCLFFSDIQADRPKLIILLMCRIGLDEPEPGYRECVLRFFKFKHFNSVLGGTPRKAHLFLKEREGYLGFLDPHKTQKTPQYSDLINQKSQYISKPFWIKSKLIDSSMSIAFVVPQEQIQIFWDEMESLKKELGQKFFLYLAKQRPAIEDDGVVEICDEY